MSSDCTDLNCTEYPALTSLHVHINIHQSVKFFREMSQKVIHCGGVSNEVLVWLFVWSEVQIVCIRSS